VVTPVVIRNSGERTHILPTAGNILSTLCVWLPRRLGLELPQDAATLQVLERHTQEQWTQMGEKYGRQGGFVGWLVVDTNAVGHWLLKVAEGIGLGGKTAFGFGRIRVSDVA
jgi:CRISPR/Cas system endoribonuclease Cas6 (RAMP superfamily)